MEPNIILQALKRSPELLSYTAVGLAATLAHFACLYLLVEILDILPAVPASIVAFVCGTGVGFIGNRSIVFNKSYASFKALSKYLLLAGINIVINTIFMSVLIKFFAWHYLLAQLFTTAGIFISNFVICKFWIFDEIKALPE